MFAPLDKCIVYEQPLNERMRALLRLEYLFNRAAGQQNESSPWASRFALETVNEIVGLVGRLDLKSELIKELERHVMTMQGLAADRRVDQQQLSTLLQQSMTLIETLKGVDGAMVQTLKRNELLNTLRQRSSIPAGACDFDIPVLQYWLNQPHALRHRDLTNWLSCFSPAQEALIFCLQFVRESARVTLELAKDGFFQKSLSSHPPCQLVRVALNKESLYFIEISAGKHRFTVRFMCHESPEQRAVQTLDDVHFQLLCCSI